ncbi:MAG: amino acid permease [Caldilineaceae bacterium SB0670_bin_27]|uniref:Amino acid permease n=1 Tax=Caldilineaceae bacterium SB0664_bin_27 TaxID=2605260 RepID=A0A6B0YVK6_9CHLR|nr:amino acid permease [Caldilineaceae bacterium SB0664_bin_27]MYJ77783.1 amino acid permease [Caldilineaceae bacterium SB0670_bin_27]
MTASAQAASAQTANASARFGTFGGVFTPNVLTILGLILFLRAGWVVGQAGLMGALLIVLIANAISFLTGLSLSAIATSMNVRAGGKYYLISRTLGREIGGAIGVPLYLSQAISVAFYIIGFTESLEGIAFFSQIDARVLSTLIAIVFAVVAFIGADFAIKIQYFILAALMAALLSFFGGGWLEIQAPTLTANYGEGMNFWSVFAVFFPAVTGIAVGASMSGDLKDPGRSIHKGTLFSVMFTAGVYFLSVVWLSLHGSPDELKSNTLIMRDIALFPPLILIGVWAATLSSALGSIVAAPRTLQAMANDGIVPRALGSRLGSRTEPRVGVLITACIAFAVIWAGDLNVVAPIITMFFLNTYGMTNLVAGIEKLVGNPSFRPRAKIHFSFSLLGAAGCYGAMFVINPAATVLAILISYGIYFYLERRSTIRTWGDVRNGIWFALARRSLLNLERSVFHAKNWRPNILVFTGQPHNRAPLVEIANLLSRGYGIVSFYQLLVGDIDQLARRRLRSIARRQIRTFIQEQNMTAFAEADIVENFYAGAVTVCQSHGVGGLEPNAVLMGWSDTEGGRTLSLRLLSTLFELGKSVLFLHHDEKRGFGNRKVIDVWWRGRSGNGDLMLLLAHIISQSPTWDGASIRILQTLPRGEGRAQVEAHLRALLDRVRVNAEPVVVVPPQGERFPDTVKTWSRETDLTLLGMNRPEADERESYGNQLNGWLSAVGTVLLIHSGQTEDLLAPND